MKTDYDRIYAGYDDSGFYAETYWNENRGDDDEIEYVNVRLYNDQIEQVQHFIGASFDMLNELLLVEHRVSLLESILKTFIAHYPSGVNPYLDAAYNDARAAIANARKE